jgi:hypothetical protein
MMKQFCGNCGSQLFGKGSRAGGMIHVKVGSIDDASFVHPEMDLFVSKKTLVRPSGRRYRALRQGPVSLASGVLPITEVDGSSYLLYRAPR